jgi:hypothetical protein
VSGELTGVEYWTMEGVRRAHGELNIGLWRVLGSSPGLNIGPGIVLGELMDS